MRIRPTSSVETEWRDSPPRSARGDKTPAQLHSSQRLVGSDRSPYFTARATPNLAISSADPSAPSNDLNELDALAFLQGGIALSRKRNWCRSRNGQHADLRQRRGHRPERAFSRCDRS